MASVGGSNLAGIAQYNERLVLQLIRRAQSLTKADIARITHLSAQTASVIINRLLAEKLLCKQKPRHEVGKVGQPAIPISLNPAGAYSLGVKIGRRGLDAVLINFTGEILRRCAYDYAYPDPDFIFPTIRRAIRELTQDFSPAQAKRLLGIGVAAPYGLGGWQHEAGIPTPITARWNSIDIKQTIQADQTLPVWLVNDATAACIASMALDNSQKFNNYLYIFVGTFIGGGIVMNSTLYSGSFNNAGAIGSMPLPNRYAAEPLDKRTPVQLIHCASRYLLNQRFQSLGLQPDDMLTGLANHRTEPPFDQAKVCFDQWLNQAAPAIAHAIAAAVSVIDFEGVIIDGSFPPELTQQLTHAVSDSMQPLDLEGLTLPRIVAGTMGNDARVVGGAFLTFYTNFTPDRNILISSAQNVSHAF